MTTEENTEVLRGVPEGTGERVAELYWEAFGAKLGAALGPAAAGRGFIAGHLNADRAVSALSAGRVVGVAGYHLAGRGLVGGDAAAVRAAYGRVSGVWRVFLLALLERTPARGELLMDGIAVDPAERGRGIGGLLLREIEAVAVEQGCHRVRLDVVAENPRARALYERHGFRAVAVRRTPWLRDVLGFGAVTTMHKEVAR
ncbi:GNAT family N-acetyltransferase [Streptomyces antarcticus]|uniref:GNAT family N-acetyltransferase n=1 Tax=Streptomyces antarcticus TaxID=2996458 RepID=UPI00227182BB|nr:MULTISPECIES: GNAT family N-acetyltransferase [unclassified Streptomyces]MCY0947132.1 GNAT family N-acetyltransferase [Streptomyces sp. H34-AA3]MCZ4087345.1 GNAT family N-acetyltransferase [Streptomyces sp. H34-S5]